MYLLTPWLWPALAAFLALAAPLLVHDARSFRLPLPLNLGLLASGLVLLPVAAIGVPGHLTAALICAGAVLVLMAVLFMIARGGLGFGDVILATGLALYGGFVSPLAALLGIWLGCLGSLVWSRVRRHRGDSGPVPFGPGLILGTALVMLVPLPGLLGG